MAKNIDQMHAWLDRVGKETVSDISGDIIAEMRTMLHPDGYGYDTGDLKHSLHDVQQGGTVTILALERWKFVNFGTPAHRITAKTAKVLAFYTGGQLRFARSVWHPGTRAYPFVQMSMEKVKRFRGVR